MNETNTEAVQPATPKDAPAYRSASGIASITIGGMWCLFFLSIGMIPTEVWYLAVINEAFSSENIFPAEWLEIILGLSSLLVFLFTGTCYCRWKYRSYRNLRALGVVEPRYSPGWAVGSYFVPILNLFRPFRAMKDVWNGSAGLELEAKSQEVNSWWAAWLIMGMLNRASSRASSRAETIEGMTGATILTMLAAIASIAACWYAIRVIRGVIDRQEARAAKLNLLPQAS